MDAKQVVIQTDVAARNKDYLVDLAVSAVAVKTINNMHSTSQKEISRKCSGAQQKARKKLKIKWSFSQRAVDVKQVALQTGADVKNEDHIVDLAVSALTVETINNRPPTIKKKSKHSS